jgi:hypothetical protein
MIGDNLTFTKWCQFVLLKSRPARHHRRSSWPEAEKKLNADVKLAADEKLAANEKIQEAVGTASVEKQQF